MIKSGRIEGYKLDPELFLPYVIYTIYVDDLGEKIVVDKNYLNRKLKDVIVDES